MLWFATVEAQNLGQRVGKSPWLRESENISVGHGVCLLAGEVEASNTPTIRRLTLSRRHQLSLIGPNPSEEYNGYRFYHIKRRRTSFCICCSRGDSHKPRIQPTGVADQTSK